MSVIVISNVTELSDTDSTPINCQLSVAGLLTATEQADGSDEQSTVEVSLTDACGKPSERAERCIGQLELGVLHVNATEKLYVNSELSNLQKTVQDVFLQCSTDLYESLENRQ